MKRRGVTLALLWQEYRGEHAQGYAYSWFCERYSDWRKRITPARSATRPAATIAPCSIIACQGCSMPWRSRGDGRHARLLKTLSRVDLLILDDWGLAPVTLDQARDLLEIVDDRHGRGSTIVTTQLPIEHWHEMIPNPTIADAILDRLVHNAHRLTLNGESMRKATAKRAGLDVEQDA